MKKVYNLILAFFVFYVCLSFSSCTVEKTDINATASTRQYSLSEAFSIYLEENHISGEVLYFTADCYNGTDETQAFAFVGNEVTGDLWFTDGWSCKKLLHGISIVKAPTVVATASKPIYIINGTIDSKARPYAYVVNESNPTILTGYGEDLTHMGGDEFCTIVTETDRKMSEGQIIGESQKKYYLYFDGTVLREYGGIQISEAEFLQLNKSEAILNGIKECGYAITELIYRANGIININCKKMTADGIAYENLTVKVIKNACVCIPSGQAQDADYVGRSTYSGSYKTAAFPDIATYPESFKPE